MKKILLLSLFLFANHISAQPIDEITDYEAGKVLILLKDTDAAERTQGNRKFFGELNENFTQNDLLTARSLNWRIRTNTQTGSREFYFVFSEYVEE